MVVLAPPNKASKELANAVYDDFKRKAIDAAKKHAVSQNVDYETFKNLVSVAHLRPLQAPNIRPSGACAPSWSFAPNGRRTKISEEQAAAASSALLSDQLPSEPPSTSGDFQRAWSRNCPTADHKYRYLRLCGPDGLRQVFKVEIGPALLKEIVTVMSTCWLVHAGVAEESGEGGAVQDAYWVTQVMEALGQAGRFQLALQMMGSSGKQVVCSLAAQLKEALAAVDAREDLHGQAAGVDQSRADPGAHDMPNSKLGQENCDIDHDQAAASQPAQAGEGSHVQITARQMRDALTRVCTVFGVPICNEA